MRFSLPERSAIVPVAFLLAVASTVLVFAGSCARPPQVDPAAARAGIDSTTQAFMNAFAAHDAKAMSLLYTEDAKVLPPNAEPVLGRDAIQKFWESVLELSIQSFRIETIDVYGSGDGATQESRYAMIGPKGETIEAGKALVVWRKTEAGWRVFRDMWSSNAPAAAPAVADTSAAAPRG